MNSTKTSIKPVDGAEVIQNHQTDNIVQANVDMPSILDLMAPITASIAEINERNRAAIAAVSEQGRVDLAAMVADINARHMRDVMVNAMADINNLAAQARENIAAAIPDCVASTRTATTDPLLRLRVLVVGHVASSINNHVVLNSNLSPNTNEHPPTRPDRRDGYVLR